MRQESGKEREHRIEAEDSRFIALIAFIQGMLWPVISTLERILCHRTVALTSYQVYQSYSLHRG